MSTSKYLIWVAGGDSSLDINAYLAPLQTLTPAEAEEKKDLLFL